MLCYPSLAGWTGAFNPCCVIPRSQIIRQLEGSTYVLNSDACTEQEWAQLEAAYDVIARPKYRSATVTARGMVRAVFLLGEQTPGRGAASHPQYATRRALGVGWSGGCCLRVHCARHSSVPRACMSGLDCICISL